MSLSDWIKPNRGYDSATATYATGATQKPRLVDNNGSVAPVAPVAVAEPRMLNTKEQAYLLNWLDSIGETNPDEIEYTIKQCETDPTAREWFLFRARKLSLARIDPESSHMKGGTP